MMPENISGVDNSQKCTMGVFILLPNSSASLYDNFSSSYAKERRHRSSKSFTQDHLVSLKHIMNLIYMTRKGLK